jgi:hypothetical protein
VTVTVALPVVALADALKLNVDVTLPFAGGVTDVGANVAVTPLGRPDTLRLTALAKLLLLATVIVSVADAPCVTLTLAGEALSEKSAGVGCTTLMLNVALCVCVPEVPVTVTVQVPRLLVPGTETVNVDDALPFAAGVTGFALKLPLAPVGRPDTLKFTAELKPLRLATAIVSLPLWPSGMVRFCGDALSE